jgi:GAF domain-containing protein
VQWDDASACAQALRRGSRVVVADVRTDPSFAPCRNIAEEAGFLAVQSTPLIGASGDVLGVLSTHFREPLAELSKESRRSLDDCAAAAAALLEQYQAEHQRVFAPPGVPRSPGLGKK